MAKSLYIGVDGQARKVKAMWIGVDGVARKVKEGFIGVADKARVFFSGVFMSLKSTLSINSGYYTPGAAVNLNEEIIFKDGTTDSPHYTKVNSNLTTTLKNGSGVESSYPSGAKVGSYAVFAGGCGRYGTTIHVEALTSALVSSFPTKLSYDRWLMAGVGLTNYALFAGGGKSSSVSNVFNSRVYVETYSTSLTHSSAANLSQTYVRGINYNNNAVFCGEGTSVLERYSDTLVKTSGGSKTVSSWSFPTPAVFNNLLFFGGSSISIPNVDTIDVYNSSFVKQNTLNFNKSGYSFPNAIVFKNELCFIEANFYNYKTKDIQNLKMIKYNTSLVRSEDVINTETASTADRTFVTMGSCLIDYGPKNGEIQIWE